MTQLHSSYEHASRIGFQCNNMGTEEEKLLVEKSQVHMCHKTGDHLTNLSVFQAWLANSFHRYQKAQLVQSKRRQI
jgi:hypothetical protein